LQTVFNEMMEGLNYKSINKAEGETSIANIVDLFIEYAYETKASDIHIEPYENISQVRFRLDGVLHDQVQIPKDVHENVVSRIKVLAKLRTDEHLSAQDGKLRRKMEYEDLDIRVSILPLVEGEKCVLRLLASHGKDFSLSELGMDEQSLEKITKAYSNPHGMILTTGPTGSGKTTTNYAVLKMLNKREVNITTIEDPVEFDIEGVNQIQVNQKTNLTFAAGLKSILRQDPDIVLVGEIRDAETAGIAINAAMTGHLVLSTLHTNDAATTLPRLIDMEIEPFLVASTINIIVAQRLVRKICNKCKVSKEVPVKELEAKLPKNLTKKHFGKKKTLTIYEGKGCAVCNHTGYSGRLGIFELLEITPEIRELVMQKANADVLREAAIKEGMITMLEDGIKKIASGATTAAEVLRVTRTEA
ncbi:type II/IV secretion system protein, partial [candidate division WWE3 bacterium]|nr:type II/IV secretion system protein [candidate division WWE3 bacterium]